MRTDDSRSTCLVQGPGQEPTRPQSAAGRASSCSVAALRVCHVSMCLLTGGLERLLVDFSRFHDRQRFELDFVALSELGPPAGDIRQAGCRVHSVGEDSSSRFSRLVRLTRFFRCRQIDVVHTHNTYAHFYAALAARLAGVPVTVNTQHGRGCGNRRKARIQFRLANHVTRQIVAVSEDAAELCRDDDPRSAYKTTRIWNGIDLDKFVFRGPSDTPTAISVARLSPEKDFGTLLKAVSLVRSAVPRFRLRIVGDGPERSHLERLARDLNVHDNVEFLGERSDIPELLAKAGFFVSSSLTEGISLTLLEAMAVGLPVLTTAVGGNPEVVVEGETGRLVPSEDPDALAAGIIAMCGDRVEWPAMGYLGRLRAEQCFDVRQMVEQYESLYRELLGDSLSS